MTSGALKLRNSTYLFPQVRGTFSLLTRFTPIPTDTHSSTFLDIGLFLFTSLRLRFPITKTGADLN